MNIVDLKEKFSLFNELWSPKIAGELNGQYVKLAKLKGEFVWHHHENEDELFMTDDFCNLSIYVEGLAKKSINQNPLLGSIKKAIHNNHHNLDS
jgi:hypothetical protein